jgi:hypothetical protein
MIITLETDENGDLVLPLGDELCNEVGWKIGDTIEWIDNEDGSWTLRKKEMKTEMVLVEAVSSFRMRYVVEVPVGKKEWALDTVTMNEAEEFSQEHIGEQIVSHRVIDMNEYDRLFAEDNSYLQNWTDEQKRKFITPLPEDEIEHTESYFDTERNK